MCMDTRIKCEKDVDNCALSPASDTANCSSTAASESHTADDMDSVSCDDHLDKDDDAETINSRVRKSATKLTKPADAPPKLQKLAKRKWRKSGSSSGQQSKGMRYQRYMY